MMLNFIKILISYIFVKIGFVKNLILKNQLVLSYHNIIPDEYYDDSIHLGVSHKYSLFVKQIGIIKNFLNKNNLKTKLVLTFDDGYRNNYKIVKDFASKQDLKVIIFISPNKRFNDEMFWIDKLLYAASYLAPSTYKVNEKEFILNNNNREEFQSKIYNLICENYQSKDVIINEIYQKAINTNNACAKNSDYFNTRFKFMTEDEIYELSNMKNVNIGYHTRDHDNLALISKKDFSAELKEEKEFLSKYSIKDFAFPFGGKNEIDTKHISSIKTYGMKNIYSNINQPINDDIKPRIGIPNISNSYLILAYYSDLFSQLRKRFFI